ncbi:MAG TPA: hypothetical protein VFC12_02660 [Terriglobales bacterium]|nr:hypothetical protein [Terriglobales bacterium]
MDETTSRICPWCSTEIPAGAGACPNCAALVEGAVVTEVPGVTVVDPATALGPDEGLIPDDLDPKAWLLADHDATSADDAALNPPSGEVRAEMRKMELEAEIVNAGTLVMNPTGDESIEVGAPSREALDALDAGLLDPVGPAGEKNLTELAAPWEDPELEDRVSTWHEQDGDKA